MTTSSANHDLRTTSVLQTRARRGTGVLRIGLFVAIVCSAGIVAPYPRAAAPLAVLGGVLCAIFLFPTIGGVASHIWGPVLGAGALVVLGQWPLSRLGLEAPRLGLGAIWSELTGHLGVPVLILSLAYLSLSLDDSGFFEWCSLKLIRMGRGSSRRLLFSVFLGVSLLTFFTSNDVVILSVTPILLRLGTNARMKNLVPLLMAEYIAANTASMGLYIGNPTNIVIGNAVGLGFVEYARRMFVPSVVATVVALGVVVILFERAGVAKRYEPPPHNERESWSPAMTSRAVLFGACLVFISVFGNPWVPARLAHLDDPAAIRNAVSTLIIGASVLCAVIAVVLDALGDRGRWDTRTSDRWRRMPVEIVPFFLSFCILLRTFDDAGLTRYVVSAVRGAFDHGLAVGSMLSAAYSVLAVNLLNNIPATILFERAWLGSSGSGAVAGLVHGLNPRSAGVFVDVSLFASNFGANLTFMGALAGLMWLRIIRDHVTSAGATLRVPTPRDFLVWGLFVVPAVTAATSLVIAWSH